MMDEDDKFKEACRLVENRCRSLGKDCEVVFTNNGVQVAPLSWPGASVGNTLYDAVKDAEAGALLGLDRGRAA